MLTKKDVKGTLAQQYVESTFYKESLDPFLRWILKRHSDFGGVTEIRILGDGAFNGRWAAYLNSQWTDVDGMDSVDRFVLSILPTWNKPRSKLSYNDWPRLSEANFYFTLNPCDPDLLARSAWTVSRAKSTVSDDDVLGYSLLAIDVDPVRKSGISSTEEEKVEALMVCNQVREWFAGHGAESIRGNSGNGWHLLFPLPLLTDKSVVLAEYKSLLEFLSKKFGNDRASIDGSICNASRIFKLYGSKAIKGSHTEERPHRWSKIELDKIPADLNVFDLVRETVSVVVDPVDGVDGVDSKKPETESQGQAKKQSRNGSSSWTPAEKIDVLDGIVVASGIRYKRQMSNDGREMWRFETCPYHTDHDGDKYECCVMCHPVTGVYSASCKHDAAAKWDDFKTAIGWAQHREGVLKRLGLWKEPRGRSGEKKPKGDKDDFEFEENDKVLKELNSKHCVVLHGGESVIVFEYFNELEKRQQISFLNKNSFQTYYENRYVLAKNFRRGEVSMPVGKWWLQHKDRATYDQVVFDPSERCDRKRCYNLWKGWAIKPQEGPIERFQNHVYEVICSKNQEYFAWLWDWMADIIQHPADRKGTVIVLKGGQGSGKSLFVDMFGKLFGHYYIYVTQSQQITGKFNSALANAILVHGAEFMWAGDRQAQSALKGLVTDKYLTVEAKHKDPIMIRNHMRLIISSNENFVVPAEFDDRRFFVLEVPNHRKGDKPYFDAIVEEMGNGGYAALMHDLLNWEITSDLRTPPDTHAKAQQKKLAARLEDEWIYECLCEGKWRSVQDGWERDQVKKDLYHAFTQYAGERGIGFRPSPQALGMSLSKIFGDELRIGKVKALYYEDNGGYSQEVWKWVNGYTFPDLERSRALYDAYSGLNEAWPEIHEEETVF